MGQTDKHASTHDDSRSEDITDYFLHLFTCLYFSKGISSSALPYRRSVPTVS